MTIQQNYPAIKSSLNLDFANTKQLDPRITYSRASTGTYYDGKTVAKAEENLLLWSQEFQNTGWLRSGAAIAADTSIAPDGTTTADTLTASAGSNSHLTQRLASVVANQNYTYTVYAKYATAQYIAFGFASGALGSAWAFVTVDIQNGTITQTTNGSNLSSTALGAVTSVGNGWYRITVTGSHSQTDTYPTIHIVNTSTPSFGNFGAFTWTAAGTETVLLWGAQLEQRSFATAYTPTTTAPITNYIPVLQTASAGTPRFDHNPITGESLGLLIEEQRTNLLTYSSDFDNAAWTASALNMATTQANALVAPDGTLTADKIIPTTTNAVHRISQSVTVTATTHTYTVFAKLGEYTSLALQMYDNTAGTSRALSSFNLLTGVATSTVGTASITAVGNGWFRCTVVSAAAHAAGATLCWVFPDTTSSFVGNGFSGIYIWGAQLEAGAFPTSYIPTVASQVTRAADSASMTGTNFSSWYNQSEGTIYTDFIGGLGSFPPLFTIDNSLNTEASRLYVYRSAASATELTNINTAVNAFAAFGTGSGNGKFVLAFAAGNYASSLNAAAPSTATHPSVPSTPNRLSIGGNFPNNRTINGTIKKIAYYPRRLTNTQIQALTS